jgi:hypothetical protein
MPLEQARDGTFGHRVTNPLLIRLLNLAGGDDSTASGARKKGLQKLVFLSTGEIAVACDNRWRRLDRVRIIAIVMGNDFVDKRLRDMQLACNDGCRTRVLAGGEDHLSGQTMPMVGRLLDPLIQFVNGEMISGTGHTRHTDQKEKKLECDQNL